MNNADKIQSVINDDLFPAVANISDVKQVLQFMEGVSQSLSEEQIRAVILLQNLGSNERLHGKQNPYKSIIESILGTEKKVGEYKKAVAPTSVYLDTIQELIPKPPKPIILADNLKPAKGGK